MPPSVPSSANPGAWEHTLYNVITQQDSFARALDVPSAARLAQVSRQARTELSDVSNRLWVEMYKGKSRDELQRLYWQALEAQKTTHVAMVLKAASGFRAELLLQTDLDGDSCLTICARENDFATVEVLLHEAVDAGVLRALVLVNTRDNFVNECIKTGAIHILELILSIAAREPRVPVQGELPPSLVTDLLERPINTLYSNFGQSDHNNCLMAAAVLDEIPIMKLLIKAARAEGILGEMLMHTNQYDSNCLFEAARDLNDEGVQVLLDAAMSEEVQSELLNSRVDDKTCLFTILSERNMKATFNGPESPEFYETIRKLLEAGGAPLAMQKCGSEGNTALHEASDRPDALVLRMLLDFGNRDMLLETNNIHQSSLHVLADVRYGSFETRQREEIVLFANTLLEFAEQLGNSVLTEFLLQRDVEGANCSIIAVESKSNCLGTLLSYARKVGVEQELLTTRDDANMSCLDYAAELDEVPVALLESPCARQLLTRLNRVHGGTALPWAGSRGPR